MGENEIVKVCEGILLVRSKSGAVNIHRVLVHTKPGMKKGHVKCSRFEEFVKEQKKKRLPSKIPVLVKNYRRSRVKVLQNSQSLASFCRRNKQNEKNRIFKMKSKLSMSVPCKETLEVEGRKFLEENEESSFKIHTPSHSTASYLLDNEVLITPTTLRSRSTSQKTARTLESFIEENETDNVTELKKKVENFSKPDFLKIKRTTLVMSQFESTKPPSENGDDDTSEETPEEIKKSRSSSSHDIKKYIDSGLRRHKSDQSRLYLDIFHYSRTRIAPVIDKDGVQPLLEEISSSIFPEIEIPEKPKEPEKEKSTKSLDKGDFELSEESEMSEPSKIDSGQLKKLKEFEDVIFTIKAEEKKDHGDFCVHTKEISDDDFSTESYKEDICIHTTDPPGRSEYSVGTTETSSSTIILRIKTKSPKQNKKIMYFPPPQQSTTQQPEPKCGIPVYKNLGKRARCPTTCKSKCRCTQSRQKSNISPASSLKGKELEQKILKRLEVKNKLICCSSGRNESKIPRLQRKEGTSKTILKVTEENPNEKNLKSVTLAAGGSSKIGQNRESRKVPKRERVLKISEHFSSSDGEI